MILYFKKRKAKYEYRLLKNFSETWGIWLSDETINTLIHRFVERMDFEQGKGEKWYIPESDIIRALPPGCMDKIKKCVDK